MQTLEKINILVVSDDKYANYCAVMLTSLLENNKKESINIHLMSSGIKEETEIFLRNIVEERYHQQLNFYIVDEQQFKNFPLRKGDHISIASYYRIICADVLPNNIDKILYLDCDIIVRDSIRELWDYDIEQYALAATLDPAWTQSQKYERLGLHPNDNYFCSGVMLINLRHWRNVNTTKLSFEVLNKMKEKLKQHDQDILNVIFNKKWLSVSYRWDYCYGQEYYFSEAEFLKDFNKESKYYPVIVHFTGPKPWSKKGIYLFQSEFDLYYNMALGKTNKARYSIVMKLKKIINKILGKSNWKEKYY